jgi:hypothetical protein
MVSGGRWQRLPDSATNTARPGGRTRAIEQLSWRSLQSALCATARLDPWLLLASGTKGLIEPDCDVALSIAL